MVNYEAQQGGDGLSLNDYLNKIILNSQPVRSLQI